MESNKTFQPAYIKLGPKRLRERSKRARELMAPCTLCPRNCEVNRLGEETGFCKTSVMTSVSSHNLHHGEEPPISGHRGSGTIFFTNCNMRCMFCQNYPISQMGVGKETSTEKLAGMMLGLQKRGAHNINFVTPSHVVGAILAALVIALENGLDIPLVYNSSGYDSVGTLQLLDGVIDIYMPDSKYSDNKAAERLSRAENYVEANRAALKEMHRQVGVLDIDDDGVATRGLLIRHLVLPGDFAGSEGVLQFIADELSPETYISLMSQYFPANKAADFPDMGRQVSREEYKRALKAMERNKMHCGYIQGVPQ